MDKLHFSEEEVNEIVRRAYDELYDRCTDPDFIFDTADELRKSNKNKEIIRNEYRMVHQGLCCAWIHLVDKATWIEMVFCMDECEEAFFEKIGITRI